VSAVRKTKRREMNTINVLKKVIIAPYERKKEKGDKAERVRRKEGGSFILFGK